MCLECFIQNITVWCFILMTVFFFMWWIVFSITLCKRRKLSFLASKAWLCFYFQQKVKSCSYCCFCFYIEQGLKSFVAFSSSQNAVFSRVYGHVILLIHLFAKIYCESVWEWLSPKLAVNYLSIATLLDCKPIFHPCLFWPIPKHQQPIHPKSLWLFYALADSIGQSISLWGVLCLCKHHILV